MFVCQILLQNSFIEIIFMIYESWQQPKMQTSNCKFQRYAENIAKIIVKCYKFPNVWSVIKTNYILKYKILKFYCLIKIQWVSMWWIATVYFTVLCVYSEWSATKTRCWGQYTHVHMKWLTIRLCIISLLITFFLLKITLFWIRITFITMQITL